MSDTTLIITITDHPPVNIVKADWPVISSAKDWDGEHEFQAFRKYRLSVRRHADNRSIVYGVYSTSWPNESDKHAGRIVEPDGDVIAAIHEVAGRIGRPNLADHCIANLPAVDLA